MAPSASELIGLLASLDKDERRRVYGRREEQEQEPDQEEQDEPTYWRVQHAADPLSRNHRSQIGSDDDELGTEDGTSAMHSLDALKRYARGGHLNWLGDLAVVGFHGELRGRGIDGEPIVRPTREVLRIPFTSTNDNPTSRAIQGLTPGPHHRKHARPIE